MTYEDPDQTALRPGDLVKIGYSGLVEETFPARLGGAEAPRSRPRAGTTCVPSTSGCSPTCGRWTPG